MQAPALMLMLIELLTPRMAISRSRIPHKAQEGTAMASGDLGIQQTQGLLRLLDFSSPSLVRAPLSNSSLRRLTDPFRPHVSHDFVSFV